MKAPGGFTRVDALAVLAMASLLGAISIPPLASSRAQSLRAGCFNNLRQVGHGFRIWASDHNDMVSPLIYHSRGGTGLHPFAVNAWLHYSWISNELHTPKVLACPADGTGRQARDFSDLPSGGFLHANFRDKALSYFLSHPALDFPGDLLAGDRNFRADRISECSSFSSAFILGFPFTNLGWTNIIHNNGGNGLFSDGRVEQFSNPAAQKYFSQNFLPNHSIHFVKPR